MMIDSVDGMINAAATPISARHAISRSMLSACDARTAPTAKSSQPGLQRALATEPVAERTGREEQAREHERVDRDDPLQLRLGRVQVAREGGDRDVQRRVADEDDEQAEAQDREGPPAAGVRLGPDADVGRRSWGSGVAVERGSPHYNRSHDSAYNRCPGTATPGRRGPQPGEGAGGGGGGVRRRGPEGAPRRHRRRGRGRRRHGVPALPDQAGPAHRGVRAPVPVAPRDGARARWSPTIPPRRSSASSWRCPSSTSATARSPSRWRTSSRPRPSRCATS